MTNLFSKILIGIVALTVTTTSTIAVTKVITQSNSPDTNNAVEINTITPTDPATVSTPPKPPKNSTVASTNTITLAELKKHNTANSCYVAYKSVVYNVTNHSSWRNCSHHGVSGGRDITSIFPHPTSYFSTLPKVGTLVDASGNPTSSKSGTGAVTRTDDDDDHEDDEHEEDHEREEENEGNHEREEGHEENDD